MIQLQFAARLPPLGAAFVLFILSLSSVSCARAQYLAEKPAVTPKNLVQNPGFENGAASFNLPAGLAAPDATQFKSGASSLKFSNSNPAIYKWASQEIPTSGGATYSFSAQIKGETVVSPPEADSGNNRGASVFLEWYDAQGTWLGGAYPDGKTGTFDWTRFGSTANLPLGARKLIIGMYLRKGSTGTAYFDDLAVVATTPPLRIFVTSPGYRGLINKGDNAPFCADLSVARTAEPMPMEIRSQILSGDKIVASQIVPVEPRQSGQSETLQLSLSQPFPTDLGTLGAAPVWKIELRNPAGEVAAEKTFAFRTVEKMPRVSIGRGGVWQIEGQPFFPLGIYSQGEADASDASLKLIADAGFNTILNYGYGAGQDPVAFLDRAQKYGLKVIYSLKDFTSGSYEFPKEKGKTPEQLMEGHINLLKNHPALLAWYLNDEGGLEREAEFRALQDQVLALDDAQHPIIHVLYQYGSLDGYYDLTDVWVLIPTPIPRFEFDIMPTWTRAAREASRGAKSTLLVPQAFSWDAYPNPMKGSRNPSADEMRTMNLLGLCEKSNGILFYAFMDLYLKSDGKRDLSQRDEAKFAREWPHVSQVSRELQTLLPSLLKAQDVELDAESSSTQLHFRALRDDQTTKILIANADGKNVVTLSLPLSRFRALKAQFGQGKISKTSKQWTIQLPPHGSAVLNGN